LYQSCSIRQQKLEIEFYGFFGQKKQGGGEKKKKKKKEHAQIPWNSAVRNAVYIVCRSGATFSPALSGM
jgi:hypothetical protein